MSGPIPLPPGPPDGGGGTGNGIVRLGDYFLIRKLAQGGMAEIFLAKKVGVGGFEKTLVLKRMLDSLSGSPEFVAMFFDEAKLAAKLTHPNIAQIYDFGVIEDRYYIAMEHIPGEDLRAVLTRCWEQRVKVPIGVALRIMIDVCAGLEHAHELEEGGKPLGVIHRDVSPSNVMVSYQGAVKLLDFGIAKATSQMSETMTGSVKGKYSFLSPEQITGQSIDARSDLFALGISFFELLTKRRPFRRDNELATIHAIMNDPIPDPRQFRDNLPEDVAVIVRKALARDPDQRYQSAALMRADLQTVLTRIAPGLGQADLVKFMLALFGRDERERKMRVPLLAEVEGLDLSGYQRSITPTPGFVTPTGSAAIVLSAERPAFVTAKNLAAAQALGSKPALSRRPTLWVGLLAGAAALAAGALVLAHFAGRAPAPRPPVALAAVAAPPKATVVPPKPSAPQPAPVAAAPAKPKAAHPTAAPAQLEGAALQAIVKRAQTRLSACFKAHSEALPQSQGQVTIQIAIDAGGRVADARTLTPEIAGTPLATCLADEARRIRFPRHADAELRFNFALVYRKGQ